MKTCTKCGETKPINDFHRDKRKADGRRYRCKACENARQLDFQRHHKAETGQYYSRRYTYERTCEVCGKTWQAKSKKARCCSRSCANKIRQYDLICEACGNAFTSTQSHARWCTPECPTAWRACRIPDTHPVVSTPIPFDHPVRWPWYGKAHRIYIPDCRWCGDPFVTQQPHQVLCSRSCTRREGRAKRKAREYSAPGTYTWAEVISLFLKFNRCCAYCRRPITGQPEPDHVVPLSRGGSNSITNILPSCRSCNGDKRDLLLHEWREDRTRRGLAAVQTSWTCSDPLYVHLAIVLPEHRAA